MRFPTGSGSQNTNNSNGPIQLDLVGLLTVIGEAAMGFHIQVITASWLGFIPRLIPAPQAFLQPMRPTRLPPLAGVDTIGVASGNIRRHLNYFADLLHAPEEKKEYSIHEVKVTRREGREQDRITPNLLGPVGILTIVGVLLALGLGLFAGFKDDGTALIAISLLSLTSTLTGIGSRWDVKLQKRHKDHGSKVLPPSDVLLRTGRGAFLLIRCDEEVARELYFGQEECEYRVGEGTFRLCAGAGTLALMASVIFLANCTWALQAACAVVYIVLNAFYWLAAVLPQRWEWDLDMYKVEPLQEFEFHTYTLVLAQLVRLTETAAWARDTEVVPKTKVWAKWLDAAEAQYLDAEWDPLAKWQELQKLEAMADVDLMMVNAD